MSNLSELLPSGGGQNEVEFVASGTLPNGQAVILNSDGTVTAVAESSSSLPEAIPKGSASIFQPYAAYITRCYFDPNTEGRLLVIYKDSNSGNYLTGVIGTVSGTSISYGTPTQISQTFGGVDVSFDPNTIGQFILGYKDGGSPYGVDARVGTISGTTISFGSAFAVNTAESTWVSVSCDPNNANKFIVATSSTSVGEAKIGTVSGTSISFGSAASFNGHTTTAYVRFNPATANQVILSYADNANSQYGTSRIGTVSGTSISYATEYVFNSAASLDNVMAVSKTGKFVVVWGGNPGKSIIGTVSGTAISYGTAVNFTSVYTQSLNVSFDPVTTDRFVVIYEDSQNSNYGTARVGTVSGSSISYGTKAAYTTTISTVVGLSFDPNAPGMFAVAYNAGSANGTAIISQLPATVVTTNLTSTNLIGISAEAITSGATGVINVLGGLNEGQSSLTPASIYYVQGNGTISTVSTSPAQKIGQAMSATTLNLKDL